MIVMGKNRRGEPAPAIVAVDDEPLNRDLLRRVLGNEFDIRDLGDARGVPGVLAERPACVVLADQLMPGQSGVELLRALRSSHPAIVGVLLTGAEEDPEVVDAARDGIAFAVVGKPWRSARLLEEVRRAVAEAERRGRGDAARDDD
ncbi:MAG: response regulator [Deltaproteobacteria bacterium]|nr:response regulator [Deltaproteobacteria bacterium]